MPRKTQKGKKFKINTLPFYIALVVLFILFIVYQGRGELSAIFGIALFMMIVIVIAIEIMSGIEEEGVTRNFIEIAAAILIVVVFWFSMRAVLRTSYPLDVVPSCSMLPTLKRGDLIALYGVHNINQLQAPIISITNSDYAKFSSNINNEFLSCVAYKVEGSRVYLSQIIEPGYEIGLYSSAGGGKIIQDSNQQGNLVQYTCGPKNIMLKNGTIKQEAYTTAVTINGTTLYEDTNNSIVVYATVPKDYFYKLGDSYIVHRAFAILNVSGSYYVLTKGDNNPGLDLQYGNYPANLSNIEGKVIGSVPYVGYLKLALSNSFVEPAGCNSTVIQ